MAIKRSGPPTTHDSVTWRVPLSASPSREWEQAFRAAEGATTVVSNKGVRFERTGLTFRSEDDQVPVWVEHIDRWIDHANQAQATLDDAQRRDAARAQQQSDTRRQNAIEANERHKHL